MKYRSRAAAILSLILFMTGVQQSAHAQSTEHTEFTSGTLIYNDDTHAPVLNTVVQMNVKGLLVRTSLTQTFKNNTANWQEGIYVFPLPDDASVDTLEMTVGERTIKGVIQTRQQATRLYQEARDAGKRSSLVEQQRANLFTTRVANIPPGGSIDINIAYQSAVRYDDGIFSLSFPMTITPRYLPGSRFTSAEPLEHTEHANENGWSNMSGITPPMVPAEFAARASVTVEIDAGIPLESINSSTHRITTSEVHSADATVSRWQVQLEERDSPMDRDFKLSWIPPRGQSPTAAIFREDRTSDTDRESTRDSASDNSVTDTHDMFAGHFDGNTEKQTQALQTTRATPTSTYASLMLLPPQQLFESDNPPREVIFVIDTSGSMQGSSIIQAREALTLGINRLSEQDTFNVIEFNDTATMLFRNVSVANRSNRNAAVEWITHLYADGGTEMANAIKLALHNPIDDQQRLRQVVFVTDGSVGNEEEIFHYIAGNLGKSRLFTVGIGAAPNTWFMRKAAEAGRGSYVSIASISEVSQRMLQLFNKLEKPVLTDIQIDVIDAPTPEYYPATIPDLYAGEPVIADLHWAEGISHAEIVISGEHAGQPWSRKLNLPAPDANQSQLAKRFAYKKIEALEDSRLFSDNPAQLEQQATRIALEYGLVTRHTSLVAIEQTPQRDPTATPLNKAQIPSAMPLGNTMAFPQGSLGLLLRWLLALMFSVLSIIFALATLQQVRSHA